MKTSSVKQISPYAQKAGKRLSYLAISIDLFELQQAKEPDEIAMNVFDVGFDVIGLYPHPVTTAISIGWSIGGKDITTFYSEKVIQTEMDLGIVGTMQTMPFK